MDRRAQKKSLHQKTVKMSSLRPRIRVGITMGDPSGIGPEICVKALQKLRINARCVVIGDQWVLDKAARHTPRVARSEVIDCKNVNRKKFSFGKIRAEYGRASMEYLDRAMEMVRAGQIDCIVTSPISKEAIHLAGFRYSGHTEYFCAQAGVDDAVMMLVNQDLTIGLVTRHLALRAIARALDEKKIGRAVLSTYQALKELFAVAKPRIVVCAINPHGSDGGLIGTEEQRVIGPAVRKLKRKVPRLDGPFGADVAIARALRGEYDAVIAMYHDQALIPLKVLGDETGVNITLGLGFVRTSPLHGTAFDIAGKNKADPSSLLAAITLAAQCCRNRKKA